MPPSTRTRAAAKQARQGGVSNGMKAVWEEREKKKQNAKEVRRVDSGHLGKNNEEYNEQDDIEDEEPHAGDKRKNSATPETENKAPKIDLTSNQQLLKFLLSPSALPVCRPDDETEDIETRGKDIKTYAQLLTPFEELLCAVILSRPISHRLGLRTIRTVLNAPYSFTDPVAIKTAGADKVRQALWDARTQHKDKTADEIELIADAVSENDWHNDLGRIRELCSSDVAAERDTLRKGVKGLGPTGLDIFYRRVQWQWEEAFPFVDTRTASALENLGLPGKPQELVEMIGEAWGVLEFEEEMKLAEEVSRRRAFVTLLERAVGADLEKKSGEVLEAAKEV